MKRPVLIMLTGWPGSGKTTVADLLAQHRGTLTVSLSDRLRTLLYKLDPGVKTLVDHNGWERVRNSQFWSSVRASLQKLGDTLRAELTPGCLFIGCYRTIIPALQAGRTVVVDGLRHPEEILCGRHLAREEGVRSATIRLLRPGLPSPTADTEHLLDRQLHDFYLEAASREGLVDQALDFYELMRIRECSLFPNPRFGASLL